MSQYSKPPIVEAVIGITFADSADDELIDKLATRYKGVYSLVTPVKNKHLEVHVDLNKPEAPSKQKLTIQSGRRLTSSDATEILVLHPKTFTLAQIAPYCGWESFFDRFKRDWAKWKFTMGARPITRIGVRFINRLDLPVKDGIVEQEEYLNIFPAVPKEFPPFNQYSVQFEITLEEIGSRLILNSGPVPAPLIDYCSFLLDIDIVCDSNVPQSDQAIFDYLSKVRVEKNKFFESAITDKARKLF